MDHAENIEAAGVQDALRQEPAAVNKSVEVTITGLLQQIIEVDIMKRMR
jgi:hypothetical protein